MSIFAMGLAALVLQAAPAQQQSETALGDVVVEGDRRGGNLETRVDRFVDAVAAPVGEYGPARWDRDVCVGAINFQPAAARVIVDRVSEIALAVGLDPEDPGCEPQVLIVATNDGPGTASGLVERNRRLFVLGGDGMDLGEEALQRFQSNDRAVRWWHVALPVDATTGQRAVRLPGDGDEYNVIQKFVASRISSAIQSNLVRVVILVDITRLGDVTFAQLADYVAMIAMAQINPEVDASDHASVLNVFADPTAVQGLTDWDLAYLGALYDARLDRVSQNGNLGAVERSMERREREAERAPVE